MNDPENESLGNIQIPNIFQRPYIDKMPVDNSYQIPNTFQRL